MAGTSSTMAPRSIRKDSYECRKDPNDSVMSPEPALEGARIQETVFNPDLKAAIVNTHLDPLSRRAFALYFVCLVAFMNSVSSGKLFLLLMPDNSDKT